MSTFRLRRASGDSTLRGGDLLRLRPISFDPPTYFVRRSVKGDPRHELWKFYDGITTGYAVLITSGVASPLPGLATPAQDAINAADAGSGEAGLAYFAGGRSYIITSGEKTILEAAGYTTVI